MTAKTEAVTGFLRLPGHVFWNLSAFCQKCNPAVKLYSTNVRLLWQNPTIITEQFYLKATHCFQLTQQYHYSKLLLPQVQVKTPKTHDKCRLCMLYFCHLQLHSITFMQHYSMLHEIKLKIVGSQICKINCRKKSELLRQILWNRRRFSLNAMFKKPPTLLKNVTITSTHLHLLTRTARTITAPLSICYKKAGKQNVLI